MKNYFIYLFITLMTLVFSNNLLSQQVDQKYKTTQQSKDKIVQKLNTPTKIWISGKWVIENNGLRTWEKGYWIMRKKTFQQKSQLFRKQLNSQSKV